MSSWPTAADVLDFITIVLFGITLIAVVIGPVIFTDRITNYARWLWHLIRDRKLPKTKTAWRPTVARTAYMTPQTYDRLKDAADLALERGDSDRAAALSGLRVVANDYVPEGQVILVDDATARAVYDSTLGAMLDTDVGGDALTTFEALHAEAVLDATIRQRAPYNWRVDDITA